MNIVLRRFPQAGRLPKASAFTLVELLVGMVVGSLLVVILFQVFNVASAAWQRGEAQLDAYREARGDATSVSPFLSFQRMN